MELIEIKAAIRAILMSLGRRATEKEFRSEYYNLEGESFNTILREYRMTFCDFLRSIPDVCRVYQIGDDITVEKVSGEHSSHMDDLTVVKNRRRSRPKCKQVSRFNVFRPAPSNQRYQQPFRPPSYQKYQQPFCAPAPSRQTSQYIGAVPACWDSDDSFDSFSPPKPKAFLAPDPRPFAAHNSNFFVAPKPLVAPLKPKPLIVPQTKPPVKVTKTRKQTLPLPPHMLLKPVVFNASTDTIEHKKEDPLPTAIKKEANDSNKSSSSSTWSDETASTVRTAASKVSRFRLRLTDVFKDSQSEKPQISPKKAEESSLKQSSESETTVKAQTISNTIGTIRKALQDLKKDMQHKEEKPNQRSDLENYITGVFTFSQPNMKTIRCLPTFEVTVVSVYSPSLFGFTFSRNQLQSLHTEMENHYATAVGIEVENPIVGMAVAVKIEEKWYRAEVLYVNPCDVLILLVDIGSRKYVHTRDLRYLEKTFASVSRKACKGKLYGVQPIGDNEQWSTEAIDVFTQKTKNVKLRATVKVVQENLYELTLQSDFNSSSKVAEHLVSNGLAERIDATDQPLTAVLI